MKSIELYLDSDNIQAAIEILIVVGMFVGGIMGIFLGAAFAGPSKSQKRVLRPALESYREAQPEVSPLRGITDDLLREWNMED